MPVNFTYGLAFDFAGCSAEIKQKGKSTQKGLRCKPVIPWTYFSEVPLLRDWDCHRQQLPGPPSAASPGDGWCALCSQVEIKATTAAARLWACREGDQGLMTQAKQRHVPCSGSLCAPCWWNPSGWHQWWSWSSCIPHRQGDLTPWQHLSDTLLKRLRAGGCYMRAGKASEARGNIWSKIHLLI